MIIHTEVTQELEASLKGTILDSLAFEFLPPTEVQHCSDKGWTLPEM